MHHELCCELGNIPQDSTSGCVSAEQFTACLLVPQRPMGEVYVLG